jgi:DNA-binding NtrC family response regulator
MTSSPTILLAEPDEALSASLRFALELQGYRVETVAHAQLLDAARSLPASACVIIGEHPRSSDGLQLGARLSEWYCRLPVIVLATNPTRATQQWARTRGIILIEKPLLGEALGNVLHTIFETNHAA